MDNRTRLGFFPFFATSFAFGDSILPPDFALDITFAKDGVAFCVPAKKKHKHGLERAQGWKFQQTQLSALAKRSCGLINAYKHFFRLQTIV